MHMYKYIMVANASDNVSFLLIYLKPVPSMTSQSLQEASQRFKKLHRTFVARPSTIRQRFKASQFSACEGMFWNTLRCF